MSSLQKPVIAVAMSGGVDSSVAAALLVEEGFEVIGMMLRLWSEAGTERYNRCCTPDAMALARRISAQLDIPFYVQDVRERFEQEIVQTFVDGYAQGITPNPCLVCNRQIRFGALLDQARALGAEALATGHYARLRDLDGRPALLRGRDPGKDQSYALSMLSPDQLSMARFPVGEYTKPEVRELARRFNLPTAERADSQDLCFLAGGDYRDFLQRRAPGINNPGEIVDINGRTLGEHQGLAFYTQGQRKGLGVSGPEPVYVLEKDLAANQLVVGPQETLGQDILTAGKANWHDSTLLPPGTKIQVQIRYTAHPRPARITIADEAGFEIAFEEPVRGITPGQAAVLYENDRVIGAGIIKTARRSA
jgi:tRNA-specific 2-thiouridylase